MTSPNSGGSGPFLAQLVRLTEYWFLTTSLLAFVGEATHGFIFIKFHHDDEDHPIVVLLEAFRHNQESGVDDWTRLLIHSVFLNSLDELEHFTTSNGQQQQDGQPTPNTEVGTSNVDEESRLVESRTILATRKPRRSRYNNNTNSNYEWKPT